MATVQTKSDISKAYDEAVKKSTELLDNLKAAFAKEKDTLEYDLSIIRRDKMDTIESECKAKVQAIDDYVSDKEKSLKDKYVELAKEKQFVSENLALIESFPELKEDILHLKKLVDTRDNQVSAMEKDFKHQLQMIEIQHKGIIAQNDTLIGALRDKVNTLTEANESLNEKLEEAYERITEMAKNTAQSASNSATISALKEVAATRGSASNK